MNVLDKVRMFLAAIVGVMGIVLTGPGRFHYSGLVHPSPLFPPVTPVASAAGRLVFIIAVLVSGAVAGIAGCGVRTTYRLLFWDH